MRKRLWPILALIVAFGCLGATLCGGAAFWLVRRGDAAPQRAWSRTEEELARGDLRATSGTLRLVGGLPPTLDPALVQDSTSAEYVVHLFSGLVSLDADLQVVPDLASRWELSEDGRIYTFYLRPDAAFADGRPILADDVVYSLERACSSILASPVAASYLGDIVGVAEYAQGQAKRIVGVEALDEHTVRIDIDAPKAYFLAKLSYPAAMVVDRDQIEGQGPRWVSSPNGSGPFVLERISRDEIVFVANTQYYRGVPSLSRVEYRLDAGHPMTMYETGELDIVGVPPTEVDRVEDPYNALYGEHVVAPELSVQYIGFNVQMPPFDDPYVRQALARAVDKEKLADVVLRNTAQPAAGILPPGMPGFSDEFIGLEYDPDVARELLSLSRYGDTGSMPEIRLTVSGTSGHMPSVAGAVVAMWRENLGLEVLVEQVEWADFLQDLNAQRYAAFSAGWIADYPDPQNFLDLLFHSASAQNHCGYTNATVDRLLEKARVEKDASRRMSLYGEAEERIVADAPWIPLTHGVNHYLVKPYVRAYNLSPSLYPWLAEVRLDDRE